MGLTGLNQDITKAALPFGGSRGESFSCSFQILEVTHIHWNTVPSHLQS